MGLLISIGSYTVWLQSFLSTMSKGISGAILQNYNGTGTNARGYDGMTVAKDMLHRNLALISNTWMTWAFRDA